MIGFLIAHSRLGGKFVPMMIAAAMMGIVVSTVWQPFGVVHGESAPSGVSLPPMSLTLVGLNGTQMNLTSSDIASLPSYAAYGGYKNQLGNIRGFGNYTGVPLIVLCNLVGGLSSGDSVLVTASDNYKATLSSEELDGIWVTYDNMTGEQVSQSQPLTPILAYYFNGANLSSTDGPLRLAVVGPEGLATNSAYWVKSVVKVEILSTSIPEFSAPPLFLVVSSATILAALVFKKKLGH